MNASWHLYGISGPTQEALPAFLTTPEGTVVTPSRVGDESGLRPYTVASLVAFSRP
jgi:hypothetical protein